MKELERTFLAKTLPELTTGKEMIDIYVPEDAPHPTLRIRKNGSKYEITKKYPETQGENSIMIEYTTPLTEEEFLVLSQVPGKRIEKKRYDIEWEGQKGEVDIFQGALKGLVLVDFEFESEEKKDAFIMPPFCLVEVTQEEFIAGGMLCGKSFDDIVVELGRFDYLPL